MVLCADKPQFEVLTFGAYSVKLCLSDAYSRTFCHGPQHAQCTAAGRCHCMLCHALPVQLCMLC